MIYALSRAPNVIANAQSLAKSKPGQASSRSKGSSKSSKKGSKNKKAPNSGKKSKSRRGAIKEAKEYAKRTNGRYRAPGNCRDHCHVDHVNSQGKVKHTRHFRWNSRVR